MPSLHISVFKYPIGMIRVIQFLFVVIAIAAVNSWGVKLDIDCPAVNATVQKKYTISVSTFSLSGHEVETCEANKKNTLWEKGDSASGSAGFFYFVNVTALIYVLLVTFVYVVFWELYQSEKRIALVDLAATALFFVLFFFCASIWWSGANTIGDSTDSNHLEKLVNETIFDPVSKTGNITIPGSFVRHTKNGVLAVSVLCDWVCVLCFAVNCWFVWKEVVPRQAENPSQIA